MKNVWLIIQEKIKNLKNVETVVVNEDRDEYIAEIPFHTPKMVILTVNR